MRNVLVVLAIVALAAPAFARNLGDSYVEIISPLQISPGNTYTFEFEVWNGSTDGESLILVEIYFFGYEVYPETMGSDPTFAVMAWYDHPLYQAHWGGGPTIPPQTFGSVWVDATVLEEFDPCFWYQLQGHYATIAEGVTCAAVSPVESVSWTAIKAMFN
jgi:hypothetical protein